MDWWLLTFFLGAILSLFLAEVPTIFQLFLLLCLAIAFYFHKKLRSSVGFCLGALWILTQAYLYHSQLPKLVIDLVQDKQSFFVEGEVLNIQVNPLNVLSENVTTTTSRSNQHKSQQHGVTKRFNLLVKKINEEPLNTPFIIRLSWQKSTIDLAQGQKIIVNVKLKPVHGLANVGTFNYVSWLKANNIVATGYVINPPKKNSQDVTSDNKKNVLPTNSTVRQGLFDQYLGLSPSHELTPILLALTFGERSLLNDEHWRVLQATGTSHLIAISGLHIGLLAGSTFFMVMFIVHKLPLNNPRWQRINMRYIAIAVSMLLATFYAYLAGFSLPTQRALVMLNLYWCSRLVGIHFSVKRLLLITLFIILMISPFSLLTASFWLSFYAVAIIFVTLWRFKSWLYQGSAPWRFLKSLLIIQLALTLMLMPITALFFQQMSLVSLLANLIAVPWMSAVSIPTALLSVLLMPFSEQLSQWLMMLSLQSLSWLWYFLDLLSNIPHAMVVLSLEQQLCIVVFGVLIFVMLYLSPFIVNKVIQKSAMSLVALVALVLMTSLVSGYLRSSQEQTLITREQEQLIQKFTPWQIVFFDVGQGLSVLITRNKQAILYDTGAAYPSGFTLSEAVILPYLQYSAIKKLDKVILSHSDNDHAGGIGALLENITIDEVISNDKGILNAISKPLVSNQSLVSDNMLSDCHAKQSLSWQGLTFDVLSPLVPESSDAVLNQGKQKNDDSCVILITDRLGHKLLLTGDISAKIEQQLLTRYPLLQVDILQVPHHGSKTSSSQAFIEQLSPRVALVSAGYLNRWRMPVTAVSERYRANNIKLLTSAELGQVIITINESGIIKRSYVEDLRPFWFSH